VRRFEAGFQAEVDDWVAEEGFVVLSFTRGRERKFVITPE
jgi:hypothetical protein